MKRKKPRPGIELDSSSAFPITITLARLLRVDFRINAFNLFLIITIIYIYIYIYIYIESISNRVFMKNYEWNLMQWPWILFYISAIEKGAFLLPSTTATNLQQFQTTFAHSWLLSVTWNQIIASKLLVLDWNTWNHIIASKQMIKAWKKKLDGNNTKCYELYWTDPGSNTPLNNSGPIQKYIKTWPIKM